jgi:hypothetical protein
MTADEIDKLIPAEVVEAAARDAHQVWRMTCAAESDEEISAYREWEELEEHERADWRMEARAAIAAGLAAWPGMAIRVMPYDALILPLPTQEKENG